jgi:hypothetical protein
MKELTEGDVARVGLLFWVSFWFLFNILNYHLEWNIGVWREAYNATLWLDQNVFPFFGKLFIAIFFALCLTGFGIFAAIGAGSCVTGYSLCFIFANRKLKGQYNFDKTIASFVGC